MRKTCLYYLAGFALAFSLHAINAAYATNITFDFTGLSSGLGAGNLGVSSTTVSSSGLNVAVEALDEFGAAGLLARNDQNGLGVVGEPGTGQEFNQGGANSDGGESLVFDFTPNAVTVIETAVFELGREAGSLNVFVDNILIDTITWLATTGGGNTGNSTIGHTFSAPLAARTGQSITFAAVEDSFRVSSFTVTQIPEPTSLGLFALSMTLIAARRS